MRFEIYKDELGEWRWRLKAANHQIIAVSGEGYINRKDAVDIVQTIRAACREDKTSVSFEKK